MDQSGPGPASRELIIDAPERQTPWQRVVFGALTLAFWAAWVYLWLPLITLLGWFGWAQRFVDVMVVQRGAATLLDLLLWYALIALVLCGALILWAVVEWTRFRDSKRRHQSPVPVSALELAAKLRASPTEMERILRSRRLVVHHNERGRIDRIECDAPAITPDDAAPDARSSSRIAA